VGAAPHTQRRPNGGSVRVVKRSSVRLHTVQVSRYAYLPIVHCLCRPYVVQVLFTMQRRRLAWNQRETADVRGVCKFQSAWGGGQCSHRRIIM